ncbi:MAG: alanine racemase [Candidatus Obscuribacterales bacterium]|nr:alanine racemase [Candidatus Obscuribacterales bacterium]
MLAQRQPIIASIRREAWVEVDLNAIEHNVAIVRSWLGDRVKLMAVVKSDAYGHGALGVADVLSACGADWLGVASVDEGCQLRAAGVRQNILLLGPCPNWALSAALDAELTLTVTNENQIADIALTCGRQNRTANIHLKIDTGMHRLGIAPNKIEAILDLLAGQKNIRLAGIFSHFAQADEECFTSKQIELFQKTLQKLKIENSNKPLIHLASGEAARRFSQSHFGMVRVGLPIYGLEAKTVSTTLVPALSVRGRINHIQEIEAGQSVGYNLTWTASRPSRIASIPIGYADGIDRRLSNQIYGLLAGKKVKQIGLISMDQMIFDITDLLEAQEGDIITLIGCDPDTTPGETTEQLHLSTWANLLDTITYELVCRMRMRMPRVYTRNYIKSDAKERKS